MNNRKKEYQLFVPRSSAVLYLAWDVGLPAVRRYMDSLPKDHRGWIGLHGMTLFRPLGKKRWTRHDLERYAARVREVVAFQQGRLGKALSYTFADVTSA